MEPFIILIIIGAALLLITPFGLRSIKQSQPDHWQTVTDTYLSGNQLIIHYKDHSFIEYKLDSSYVWRRLPSMKRVDDAKQKELNDLVISIKAKRYNKRKGRGGLKTLRN